MNVYIVIENWGEYSDYREWIRAVFTSEEAAESFIRGHLVTVYKDEDGEERVFHSWDEGEETYKIAPDKKPVPGWLEGNVRSYWCYGCGTSYDTSDFRVEEMEVQE